MIWCSFIFLPKGRRNKRGKSSPQKGMGERFPPSTQPIRIFRFQSTTTQDEATQYNAMMFRKYKSICAIVRTHFRTYESQKSASNIPSYGFCHLLMWLLPRRPSCPMYSVALGKLAFGRGRLRRLAPSCASRGSRPAILRGAYGRLVSGGLLSWGDIGDRYKSTAQTLHLETSGNSDLMQQVETHNSPFTRRQECEKRLHRARDMNNMNDYTLPYNPPHLAWIYARVWRMGRSLIKTSFGTWLRCGLVKLWIA